MDNWIDEVLDEAGFLDKQIPKFSDMMKLYESQYDNTIVLKQSAIMASLDHDHKVQKLLSDQIEESLKEFKKDKRFDATSGIRDLVLQLFTAIDIITKRNPTTSIYLRKVISDVQSDE